MENLLNGIKEEFIVHGTLLMLYNALMDNLFSIVGEKSNHIFKFISDKHDVQSCARALVGSATHDTQRVCIKVDGKIKIIHGYWLSPMAALRNILSHNRSPNVEDSLIEECMVGISTLHAVWPTRESYGILKLMVHLGTKRNLSLGTLVTTTKQNGYLKIHNRDVFKYAHLITITKGGLDISVQFDHFRGFNTIVSDSEGKTYMLPRDKYITITAYGKYLEEPSEGSDDK